MPYVPEASRSAMSGVERAIKKTPPMNAGELQYLIAVMIREMKKDHDFRYQDMNDVMGALAGAQMEFYRRTVAPYEDVKIQTNGDV